MSQVQAARRALVECVRMYLPTPATVAQDALVALNGAMDTLQAAVIADLQILTPPTPEEAAAAERERLKAEAAANAEKTAGEPLPDDLERMNTTRQDAQEARAEVEAAEVAPAVMEAQNRVDEAGGPASLKRAAAAGKSREEMRAEAMAGTMAAELGPDEVTQEAASLEDGKTA